MTTVEAEAVKMQPVVVEISVNDLVEKANAAMNKMATKNPHRRVVWELGNALVALADRYSNLEARHEKNLRELEQLTIAVNKMREQEDANAQSPSIVAP